MSPQNSSNRRLTTNIRFQGEIRSLEMDRVGSLLGPSDHQERGNKSVSPQSSSHSSCGMAIDTGEGLLSRHRRRTFNEAPSSNSNRHQLIGQNSRTSSRITLSQFSSIFIEAIRKLSNDKSTQNYHYGVHLTDIIEHSSLSKLNELNVKLIDSVIDSLVSQKRLKLRLMSQNELYQLLERQKKPRKVPQNVHANQSCQNVSQSTHFAYLMSLEPQSMSQDACSSFVEPVSDRRVSRLSSISNQTAKSKSTTLDSGIQSWDLASSTTDETGGYATCRSPLAMGSEPESSGSGNSSSSSSGSSSGASSRSSQGLRGSNVNKTPAKCQPQDPNGAGRASEGANSFSLGRSLSFRLKQDTGYQGSGRWAWKTSATEESEQNGAKSGKKMATNHSNEGGELKSKMAAFSCLFRSKSMRVTSSGKLTNGSNPKKSNQTTNESLKVASSLGKADGGKFDCDLTTLTEDGERMEKMVKSQVSSELMARDHNTYDYLSMAQPHKRSFSMRKNCSSLLNSSKKYQANSMSGANQHPSDVSSGSNHSGAKLILFLRRLFSVRRTTTTSSSSKILPEPSRQHETMTTTTTTTHHHHCVHLIPAASIATSSNPNNQQTNNSSFVEASDLLVATPTIPMAIPKPLTQARPLSQSRSNGGDLISDSQSSDSSLGSNSLIEILDHSHRPLREERAHGMSRATWRLVKRSNSSLSDASNSTIKSSVSQQLRRHLDEAYKRHRKCSNRREKEFIDSINVLRQASRHALQSSRPLSKTRQSKQADYSACSHDCDSKQEQVSACEACRCPESEEVNDSNNNNNDNNKNSNNHDSNNEDQTDHLDSSQRMDLIQHNPEPETLTTNTLEPQWQANDHSAWLGHNPIGAAPLSLNAGITDCCWFCSPSSNGSRMPSSCPMAICSNGVLPGCCLAAGSPIRGCSTNHLALGELDTIGDLSCPLWRSMVQNYYQTCLLGHPAGIPVSGANLMHQHQHQQMMMTTADPLAQMTDACQNFKLQTTRTQQTQSQQQHQHNTTIDLKIEIGADLKSNNDNHDDALEASASRYEAVREFRCTTDDDGDDENALSTKPSKRIQRGARRRAQVALTIPRPKHFESLHQPRDSLDEEPEDSDSAQKDESLINRARSQTRSHPLDVARGISYEPDSCESDSAKSDGRNIQQPDDTNSMLLIPRLDQMASTNSRLIGIQND